MSDVQTAPKAPASAADRSTHFVFEHKVFNVEGAYFAPGTDDTAPLFHVVLGDIKGAMTLDSLRTEFGIKNESSDGKLLGVIERSLRFVKKIHPNDSIPREILDGSASWQVEDRHREVANSRLSYQLATWLSGKESVVSDADQLQMLVEDPAIKKRVLEGLEKVAEKLGLGKDNKSEVVNRIDVLARELAYIEALRERVGAVRMIQDKLVGAAKVYARDRHTLDEISRMQVLVRKPMAEFAGLFKSIDSETGEIVALLQNLQARVDFIRNMRDELHFMLMKWDELIALWQEQPIERSDAFFPLFKKTYQFLAQHYRPGTDWSAAR
jgi:hypothetical protein